MKKSMYQSKARVWAMCFVAFVALEVVLRVVSDGSAFTEIGFMVSGVMWVINYSKYKKEA